MYLRMIAVEASATATVPSEPVFRWTAHHVKEVFLALLPKRFLLDGSSKVQITCGPRGKEPQFHQVLGTTNYFREDFDFFRYYTITPLERDHMLLGVLRESFIDIASRASAAIETRDAILTAAHDVASHDFGLKLHSKKLSRATPCRRVKVNIYRNLNRQAGEAWSSEVVGGDQSRIHEEWLGEVPRYLDLTEFYKSSNWEGGVFVIRDRFDETVYELDVNPFLAQL